MFVALSWWASIRASKTPTTKNTQHCQTVQSFEAKGRRRTLTAGGVFQKQRAIYLTQSTPRKLRPLLAALDFQRTKRADCKITLSGRPRRYPGISWLRKLKIYDKAIYIILTNHKQFAKHGRPDYNEAHKAQRTTIVLVSASCTSALKS